MTEPTETAVLRIQRGGPGEQPRYDRFEAPFEPGQSVLDGLRWLRIHHDPTIAVRYSCINANACKECVMRIDGKVGYACTTKLRSTEMTLEPLANKPLIRDLVTEIAPPNERLQPAANTSNNANFATEFGGILIAGSSSAMTEYFLISIPYPSCPDMIPASRSIEGYRFSPQPGLIQQPVG